MLNLSELRLKIPELKKCELIWISFRCDDAMQLLDIVEAALKFRVESDLQSLADPLKRRVFDVGETIEELWELLEGVEV